MTAVRDLEQKDGETGFTVTGSFGEHRVRFFGDDVPRSPTPPVEVALASALLPAMTAEGELSLPGPLSAQLQRALPDVQAFLAEIPKARNDVGVHLQPVDVTTPSTGASREGTIGTGDRGIGLFFSGGIDSWSVLLSNSDVTDLIYVQGFDIPLGQPEASAVVEQRLAEVAKNFGKRLRVIRTDLRDLLDPSVPWEIAHGTALASAALLLEPVCERVLIGAGMSYDGLVARGSHPLHDHLWSTESCHVELHGTHMRRAAKTVQVSQCKQALDMLRVCWRRVDLYNCGRCEKCLRTMTALQIVDALERCPTFEARLDLDNVATLQFEDPDLFIWWSENLQLAYEYGASPKLIRALEACLDANGHLAAAPTDQLRAQLAAKEARAGALERELEEMRSSRSWRMTAPIRQLGTAARRIKRSDAAGF